METPRGEMTKVWQLRNSRTDIETQDCLGTRPVLFPNSTPSPHGGSEKWTLALSHVIKAHLPGKWKRKSLSRVWLFVTPRNFPGWNTGVGSLSLLQGHCEKQRDKNRAEVGGISWNSFLSTGVWKGGLSRSATAREGAYQPFSFPFSLPFSFHFSLTLCNIPLQGLKLESCPVSSEIHTFHWG